MNKPKKLKVRKGTVGKGITVLNIPEAGRFLAKRFYELKKECYPLSPHKSLISEEKLREKIAQRLFKIQFPDLDWGHNGTSDDDSWRRFEQKCLWDATKLLALIKESQGEPPEFSDEAIRGVFTNLKVVFNSQETDEHKMAIIKTLVNRSIVRFNSR